MKVEQHRLGGSFARWKRFSCMCLLLAGAVFAGQAAGQVAVSDGGQAAYSVPIQAPPGIAGLEPKLALQYSRGAGGPFGIGWSLGGLSVITRCGSTEATDGIRKGVRYTADDRFCLDGQRLIITNDSGVPAAKPQGNYSGSTTEYRTEKDSYSRVRAYGGSSTTGPAYFKVWTKSGLVYEYGNGGNSLIDTVKAGAATGIAMAWAVNQISDTVGNYMSISYLRQANSFAGSVGREWMVSQVRYTGNGGQQPANRIDFTYEDRPDKTEAFHEGAKSVNTRRLASVATFVGTAADGTGGRPVSLLNMQYSASPNAGKSMLASVQQCSGLSPSKCLPKTEFTYSSGPTPSFSLKSLTNLTLAKKDDTKGYTRGVYQGDFDGDGKQDLLVWDDDPNLNQLLRSNGDGTFSSAARPLPGDPQIGHSNGCNYATIADFNTDGIADVLHIQDPNAGENCSGVQRRAQIFLGQASGTFQSPVQVTRNTGESLALLRVDPVPWCAETSGTGQDMQCVRYEEISGRNYTVVDVNGDGLPDILFTRTPPHLFDSLPTTCTGTDLTCVFLGSTTVGQYTPVSTSLAQENLFAAGGWLAFTANTYQTNRVFFGDLNGDGLPDAFLRDTGVVYIATGTTAQFSKHQAAPTCAAGAEVLDINGDGKWDLACMDYTNTAPYKAYVNDGTGNFVYRSNVSDWAGVNCTTQVGEEPVAVMCDPMYRGFINYLAADLDGDGVSDILALGKSRYAGAYPEYNGFLKGQRDGSFAAYSIPSLGSAPLAWDKRQLLAGDFTGRGSVELLRYSDNSAENALFQRNDSLPPDLLLTVKTAGDAQTAINYIPLADTSAASVYTRGTGAQYPVIDYVGAQWVVASVDAPNGRNGTTSTTYKYSAQRADLTGRGSLGFETITKTAPGADGTLLSTRTTNRQDFPYAGLPSETRRYKGSTGSSWQSLTTSTYGTICPSTSSQPIYRTVLQTNVEQTRDLNNAAISHVETRNEGYNNCFGDPGTVTITTRKDANASDSYVKVTTNTYTQDTSGDTWILGRLSTATQTNTVPLATMPAVSVPPPGTGTTPAPTITVTRTPSTLVAGEGFTTTWSSTNASTVSYACTSTGTGFAGSATMPTTSGSDSTGVAQTGWVNNPSDCTWTATGSGGTTSIDETMTTVAAVSDATYVSHSVPTSVTAGQVFTVSVTMKNTGNTTWTAAKNYNLGSQNPQDNEIWGPKRVAPGASVPPGQQYTFSFPVTAPATAGTYNFQWKMVQDFVGWFGVAMPNVSVTVAAAPAPTISVTRTPSTLVAGEPFTTTWSSTNASTVSYSCVAGGTGFNGSATMSATSGTDTAGVALSGWVNNPSTCTWTATGAGGTATFVDTVTTVAAAPNATLVSQSVPATMVPGQAYSVSVTMRNTGNTTWTAAKNYYLGSQNPQDNTTWGASRVALGASVAPNQQYTFSASVTAPATAGSYNFQWQMVQDFVGWFGAASTNVVVNVTTIPPPTISVSRTPSTLVAGESFTTAWSSTNASAVSYSCVAGGTGFNGSATMSTTSGSDSAGVAQSGWVGNPSTCTWTATGAGGTATFVETLTTVAAAPNATFVSQSVPSTMTPGQAYTVSVTMKNTGNTTWTSAKNYKLGARNPTDNTYWLSTSRVLLGTSVAPNQQYTFSFSVTAPSTAGTYNFQWQMVQDFVAWFGATSTNVAVTVGSTIPAPTINVTRTPSPMVAGETFSLTWGSTNATAVSYNCTASGTGFVGSATLAANSSSTGTANAAWVGYPSTCTWTATGAGGTATYVETMTTVAAAPNATFISQSVPVSMVAGQSYAVSVTMKNTGNTTWTAAKNYKLGAQNPQDTTTWAPTARVLLDSSVAPNQQYTFAGTVTAPSTGGTYNFQWKMVQDGVAWFGALSTNVAVAVTAPTPAPTISVSAPSAMYTDQPYAIVISTTNASTVTNLCTSGSTTKSMPAAPNTTITFTPDISWYGTWLCTWTATGAGGSTTTPAQTISVNVTVEPGAGA